MPSDALVVAGAQEGWRPMAIVALISFVAIAFLLACLRAFQAALKERRTVWAFLIRIEKEHVLTVPHPKPQPDSLPKAA
ncbi:MAG TPA: hypothetical protein VI685_21030 [Candidatus Angelobacter sp.]